MPNQPTQHHGAQPPHPDLDATHNTNGHNSTQPDRPAGRGTPTGASPRSRRPAANNLCRYVVWQPTIAAASDGDTTPTSTRSPDTNPQHTATPNGDAHQLAGRPSINPTTANAASRRTSTDPATRRSANPTVHNPGAHDGNSGNSGTAPVNRPNRSANTGSNSARISPLSTPGTFDTHPPREGEGGEGGEGGGGGVSETSDIIVTNPVTVDHQPVNLTVQLNLVI